MTIFTDWKVIAFQPSEDMTVGGGDGEGLPDAQTNLTPFLKGCEVISEVEFGKLGEASIVVVLENSAGTFTPPNGPNWFENQFLALESYADTTDGSTYCDRRTYCITDVQYQDDGFSSEVTVFGRDMSVLLARTGLADISISSGSAVTAMDTVILNHVPAAGLNKVGSSGWIVFTRAASVTIQFGNTTLSFPDGTSVLDVIRDIAANETIIMKPPTIKYWKKVTFPAPIGANASCELENMIEVQTPNVLTGFGSTTFHFADPTAIAAGRSDGGGGTVYDLLPYRALQFGTTTDRLITQSHMADSAGTSSTSTNATSTAIFGARGNLFTTMPVTTPSSGSGGGTSQDYLDDRTGMMVNWWDTIENYVEGIEVSSGMIEQLAQNDALTEVKELMGLAVYLHCEIKINGAGGTTRTAYNTFLRSVLTINPTEWVVRLERGIGEISAFTFQLDSDEFGVLDENKVAAPTRS